MSVKPTNRPASGASRAHRKIGGGLVASAVTSHDNVREAESRVEVAREFKTGRIASADARLVEDLDFDSFEAVRLVIWIEERTGVAEFDRPPPSLATVGEAYGYYA